MPIKETVGTIGFIGLCVVGSVRDRAADADAKLSPSFPQALS